MGSILSPQPIKANESIYASIRVIIGFLMLYHGLEIFDSKLMHEYANWEQFKNLPFSLSLVYVGKGLEFITGLLFVLGFFIRIAALLMAFQMVFICFYLGNGNFWYEDQHPFLFALIAVLYFSLGSGKWSIDQLRAKK